MREGEPRGQNRDILVGFLSWVAFSVSPVVPFAGKILADFSHLDNLLGPFSGDFRQF